MQVDLDLWQPLDLEWHGDYAFLDGALVGSDLGRDTYIMLSCEAYPPALLAERAAAMSYPKSPFAAGQSIWRHRHNNQILTDQRLDYYLLPRYFNRYGFHIAQALPFRFNGKLHNLGQGYWRDFLSAYYFHDYAITQLNEAHLDTLAPLHMDSGKGVLFSDGIHVYAHGQIVGNASDHIRQLNHPAYQVINGQVCRAFKPLNQKDGSLLKVYNPNAFEMLAKRWGSDGQSVVVQAQQGASIAYVYFYRIDDADIETFTVLNERYAKDRRRGYYLTGKTIGYVGNFHVLSEWVPHFDESGCLVDAEQKLSEYFAVDDQYVYCAGVRVKGAHGPTFRHLGNGYYCDQHRAYKGNKPLDVDLPSFIVTQLNYGEGQYSPWLVGDCNSPLEANGIIDASALAEWAPYFEAHPDVQGYWWHRMQAKAVQHNPVSLQELGAGFEVGKDVYFYGRLFEGLHAASFRVLSSRLCGDKNGLYLIPYHNPERRLPERFSTQSVEHFRQLDEFYISDGQTLFCHSVFYRLPVALPKVDLPSFNACDYGWGRDNHAIYYLGVAKKRLDPQQTQISGNYAFCQGAIFYAGKPLDVEFSLADVQIPHPDFLQLSHRKLFCGRRPVSAKRVDLASLEFVSERLARDKSHFYLYDEGRGLRSVDKAQWQ